MALNIKDAATEALAAEVAALTGESKTGAIRESLRERRERLRAATAQSNGRLRRFLQDEAWPQVPVELLDGGLEKHDRERILGYGEAGV